MGRLVRDSTQNGDRLGVIPNYARLPSGELAANAFYYKDLGLR